MKLELIFQQKRIQFNTILVLYFFINWIFSYSENASLNGWLSLIMLFVLVSDYILYKSNIKGSIKALVTLHLLQFVPVIFGIYLSAQLSFNAFFFLLGLMIIELYIILPYEERHLKTRVAIVSYCALLISTLVITLNTHSVFEILLNISFILLSLYFFISLFDEFKDALVTKLILQTRLFKESLATNEELKNTQTRFKLTHEELAKQKYELEVANVLLNKMSSEIYTQNELLRYISSILDITELLDVVNDAILGTIGVDTCSLVLFDEREEKFLYNVKSNFPGNHLNKLIESVESGALEKYFATGKIHLNNRVILTDYDFLSHRPVGSIAIIPLLRDYVTYGLIIAEHVNTDMFTENNIQFFTGISTQITIAINNANIYALMEDMAIKDGLTGIYNRKYLQDYLPSLLTLKSSFAQPILNGIAVALFDIDKFKSVNDRYGHIFGDEAIKMIARKALKYAKSYGGTAVRYGGEEFVLVFPNQSMEQCNQIIQQLHNEIKEEELLCSERDEVVKINVSIGISHYPTIATSINDLLSRADNAMYYSKQNGRGQITLDKTNLDKCI